MNRTHCGVEIPGDAELYPYCGESLEETPAEPVPQVAGENPRRKLAEWILFAVAGTILLATFLDSVLPALNPCSSMAVDGYLDFTSALIEDWDEADARARSATGASLGSAVGELREIRHNLNDVRYPECASDYRDDLLAYMDHTIDGHLAVLAQDPDDQVQLHFGRASRAINRAMNSLRVLRLEAGDWYSRWAGQRDGAGR